MIAMTLVTPKAAAEAGLWNKSSCLAAALGVTEFIAMTLFTHRVTRIFEENLPNISKSSPSGLQVKKGQNIYNRAQFENTKHLHQTTFETLKYLQQTMF
jgi:hypothetical protein